MTHHVGLLRDIDAPFAFATKQQYVSDRVKRTCRNQLIEKTRDSLTLGSEFGTSRNVTETSMSY
jgi:hypothetical protein